MSIQQIAQQFANALDANDFQATAALLATTCTYSIDGKVIEGVEAIVSTYESANAWAQKTFDIVRYKSNVDEDGLITFIDDITHRDVQHIHRCTQRITVNPLNAITHIEHIELPGEKDSLNSFFEQVGISRDS